MTDLESTAGRAPAGRALSVGVDARGLSETGIGRYVREVLPGADAEAGRLLGPAEPGQAMLLHVGSTVPRKRIDVLLPYLRRDVLAALVLQTSSAEGFGLPVTEAMACGTPVVASDLPIMREVGGDAAEYAPAADVGAWRDAVDVLLAERAREPGAWEARRRRCVARARLFSWEQNARAVVRVYDEVLQRSGRPPAGQPGAGRGVDGAGAARG